MLWLLSIMDNIRPFIAVGTIICTLSLLGSLIAIIYSLSEGESDLTIQTKKTLRIGIIIGAVITIIGSLFPTRRDLVEAYFMIEGRKVIASENFDKVMSKVEKKIDRMLKEDK